MAAKKRAVEFLDNESSDEDDYYASQRKRALLGDYLMPGTAPNTTPNNKPGASRQSPEPENGISPQDQAETSVPENDDEGNSNPFLDKSDDEAEEIAPPPPSTPPAPAAVSDEDDDEEEESSSSPAPVRSACMYGASCYRINPQHKADFSHPGDVDYVAPVPATTTGGAKPPCQFGTGCYRKNPQHIRDFDHSQPPVASPTATVPPKKLRKAKTKKNENKDDDDYESDFIDDEESEEEEIEESDEEWDPDEEED